MRCSSRLRDSTISADADCWDSAQGEEVNEIMDSDDEVEWGQVRLAALYSSVCN